MKRHVLQLLTVALVVVIPTVALAGDASSDILGGVVGLVQANPKVAAALSIVAAIQHAAPWLALLPAIWGGNTASTGAGSGWSRFWRKVENFPQVGGGASGPNP